MYGVDYLGLFGVHSNIGHQQLVCECTWYAHGRALFAGTLSQNMLMYNKLSFCEPAAYV